MTVPADFVIRTMHSPEDMRAAELLQQEVWGFEPMEVVPHHVLVTAARHGGLSIGAFRDDRPLALSFAFFGVDHDGTPVLCSHMLGTTPEARGLGLGIALKWAQRKEALEMGIERIVWTFDPLEHGNARLNTQILGGRTNRYLENVYGEMRDSLNAGLPSDRLEIVWDLQTSDVMRRAAAYEAGERMAVRSETGPVLDEGAPGISWALAGDAERVCVSAPPNIQAIRSKNPEEALAWRLHVRSSLTDLFGQGFILTGAELRGAEAVLCLTHQRVLDIDL